MPGAILVVDEDALSRQALADRLERLGHEVFREAGGKAAIETFERTGPDAVVLALHFPEPASSLAFEELRRRGAALILLLGHGFAESEVRAMQLGAEQVLTKPMEMAHLEAVIARVLDRLRACRRCGFLRARVTPQAGPDVLGPSPSMRALAGEVRRLALAGGSTVLITGEPGTGKGLVARMLHDASPRAAMPFVPAVCATDDAVALAEDLFGVERGGDAGPRERQPGLFELAEGGTLFLDEIGLLPAAVQPALLEALETRVVRRVGGPRSLRVDVRAVAATSHDVGAAIRAGRFREDLFARLNVAPLHLPAVRERAPEDRLALIERLVAVLRGGIPGSPARLAPAALEGLVAYGWPGNAREMRAMLERALLLARGEEEIGQRHLPPEVCGRPAPPAAPAASAVRSPAASRAPRRPIPLEAVEQRHIERTLRRHGGNRTHAAEELGISRATLINKIRTYGLDVRRPPGEGSDA